MVPRWLVQVMHPPQKSENFHYSLFSIFIQKLRQRKWWFNGASVVSVKQWISKINSPPCLYFLKYRLVESCSTSEDLWAYKSSWSHVDWWKFLFHFRSLNVHHFGMVEAMGLNLMTSRSPSMAWPLTNFIQIWQQGQTHRQECDLINLFVLPLRSKVR
jgi:hypothetical protein